MGTGEHENNLNNLAVEEGIWQKLRSSTVPLLYVLVGAPILVTVIIILAALLSVRGEIPETKAVEGSPAAQCGDDWNSHRGKCYYFSDRPDTWNNSQDFCKSHNSSLAIIHNKQDLNFLNLLKHDYWIGLSRTQDDSGWVWTDGRFYSKTIFDIKRQPRESGESECVFLNNGGLRSERGRYEKKWICSKRL